MNTVWQVNLLVEYLLEIYGAAFSKQRTSHNFHGQDTPHFNSYLRSSVIIKNVKGITMFVSQIISDSKQSTRLLF